MTGTMTAAQAGTDLIAMLASATVAVSAIGQGNGSEFASQLLSAQTDAAQASQAQAGAALAGAAQGVPLAGGAPEASGLASDSAPSGTPDGLGLPALSGSPAPALDLSVVSGPGANPAGPPAEFASPNADGEGTRAPAVSAVPTPPAPWTTLSSSAAAVGSALPVVSAELPAPADTTIPTGGKHADPRHRISTDAPALQVLPAVPSPIAAASAPPAGQVGPVAAQTDDDADASSALTESAASVVSLTPIDQSAAPRPVSARNHVAQAAVEQSAIAPDGTALRDASAIVSPIAPAREQSRQSGSGSQFSDGNASATAVDAAAAPAPAAPTAAATPVAAPAASAPAPLADQLARPIFTLRTAAVGTHVMTIRVAPESIGPVTVRAHINSGDIRVQLIAPTDESNAALSAILADLKRDLAQGGMNAILSLHQHTGTDVGSDQPSSQGQDSQPQPQPGRADSGSGGRGTREPGPATIPFDREPMRADQVRLLASDSALDVLA